MNCVQSKWTHALEDAMWWILTSKSTLGSRRLLIVCMSQLMRASVAYFYVPSSRSHVSSDVGRSQVGQDSTKSSLKDWDAGSYPFEAIHFVVCGST